jgi:hypothetical protein
VLNLNGCRRNVPLTLRVLLLRRRTPRDPAFASVVTHPIHDRRIVDDGLVIHVVNIGDVHIRHRPVVEEAIVIPSSALETITEITEPVVDAAIETDLRSPIALMKKEHTPLPAPPRRGPQEAYFRSQNPGARHPKIVSVVVIPRPITWRPYVALAGAKRLLIDR